MNRRLRHLPRLTVAGRGRLWLTRRLLRAATIGSAARVRRRGLELTITTLPTPERTPVRIIRPQGSPRGLLVDFHGGAWAIGLAAMDDKLNTGFAEACGLVVASVDYRLAMPRAIGALQAECAAALLALLKMEALAEFPVFLTGESAGGHLALSAAQRLASHPLLAGRFAGLLLHYGAYDLGGSPSALAAGPDTLVLDGPSLERQIALLCPRMSPAERRRPALSPLYGEMAGLPPTLIVVGDIDPLRDDSLQLAEHMHAADVAVETLLLPGAPHGILHMRGLYAEKVRRAGREWLDRRLSA
ncbi:alpha/beta hydrolase fold domain-containing protein [Sphingopyxis sp. NJF-3]